MPARTWIIEDWTGKRLYPATAFRSFGDGWEFVRDNMGEEYWEDVYVVLNPRDEFGDLIGED